MAGTMARTSGEVIEMSAPLRLEDRATASTTNDNRGGNAKGEGDHANQEDEALAVPVTEAAAREGRWSQRR
jgi:hypothetical protein